MNADNNLSELQAGVFIFQQEGMYLLFSIRVLCNMYVCHNACADPTCGLGSNIRLCFGLCSITAEGVVEYFVEVVQTAIHCLVWGSLILSGSV